jgi:hypothetical protein
VPGWYGFSCFWNVKFFHVFGYWIVKLLADGFKSKIYIYPSTCNKAGNYSNPPLPPSKMKACYLGRKEWTSVDCYKVSLNLPLLVWICITVSWGCSKHFTPNIFWVIMPVFCWLSAIVRGTYNIHDIWDVGCVIFRWLSSLYWQNFSFKYILLDVPWSKVPIYIIFSILNPNPLICCKFCLFKMFFTWNAQILCFLKAP